MSARHLAWTHATSSMAFSHISLESICNCSRPQCSSALQTILKLSSIMGLAGDFMLLESWPHAPCQLEGCLLLSLVAGCDRFDSIIRLGHSAKGCPRSITRSGSKYFTRIWRNADIWPLATVWLSHDGSSTYTSLSWKTMYQWQKSYIVIHISYRVMGNSRTCVSVFFTHN